MENIDLKITAILVTLFCGQIIYNMTIQKHLGSTLILGVLLLSMITFLLFIVSGIVKTQRVTNN
jgi:hypothetical protein